MNLVVSKFKQSLHKTIIVSGIPKRGQAFLVSLKIIIDKIKSSVQRYSKDGRIVEDRALGIYPNSVYALYTCK